MAYHSRSTLSAEAFFCRLKIMQILIFIFKKKYLFFSSLSFIILFR